jgi:plastocyanin
MRKLILIAAVASAAAAAAVPAVSALASTTPKTVGVKDNFFTPKTITIKRGTRVNWVWHSFGILHNVTVKSGPSKFHSRNKSGGSYTHLFNKKGTYHLICTLHPTQMKETIIVR